MNKESVLVDAKLQYTKQLISVVENPIYEKLIAMYQNYPKDAKESQLINFQRKLKDIPSWNQNQIDEEVKAITKECPWVEDLLAAIFVSNVKILSSVKLGKSKDKIQLKMPKIDQFIHKLFVNIAMALYCNPYVFSSKNYQNIKSNKLEVLQIISNITEETIRTMLPFENILENFLGNALHGESESEASESEPEASEAEDEEPTESVEHEDDSGPGEDVFSDEEGHVSDFEEEPAQFPEQPNPEACSLPASPVAGQANGFFDKPNEVKSVPLQGTVTPEQAASLFPDAVEE
tara:strand:+ start:9366 stop:10238 length:873 start_codon:yes stop_codon:yes gene_type:complete